MSGFPQQHNNGWSHEAKERQNFMEQYVTHGHLPPILLPDPTQHHHTSPHHVNQILSTPVDFPSHPVQPLLHNAGASQMHNAASLVRRNRAKTKPWTEEEHRLFLLGLQTHEKGQWKQISRDFVKTKSSTQIASHAQKYFIRQSVSPTKKRRKSIHDITLHNTNGVPYHIDPQNSISLPEIQPIHEMQQIQQMSLLNPLDNMTQSEFGYSGIANQQVDEMQQVFPLNPPGSSMTQSEFEYSGIANQQVDEMQQMFPLNPPNSVTHQIGGFENSDIANQQNHEMQQMPLNPPNSMTHQMSGFDSDIAYQQVYGIQPILPVDPSNRMMTRQMNGF